MSQHSDEYLNKYSMIKHFVTVDKDGKEIQRGGYVTDFRGHVAEFIRATRARSESGSGKVVVHRIVEGCTGEYYDHAFNLHVKEA